MIDNKESFILEKANYSHSKSVLHTPSTIQADTLFNFNKELDYLLAYIRKGMIPPRYNVEDIRYLKIRDLRKIAYPMKCFCDINMHRLDIHMEWYGYYGIAFSKEWCMSKGIQPVQYINQKSKLSKDFSTAFRAALKLSGNKTGSAERKMQNYLLHELMYYKPYDGMMDNRNSGKKKKKCFTDECEWRYIPDVTVAGYHQVLFNEEIIEAGILGEISNSMATIPEISLRFKYSDIKYLIIKTVNDFEKLVNEIIHLKLPTMEEYELISKIIIWDKSRGDF